MTTISVTKVISSSAAIHLFVKSPRVPWGRGIIHFLSAAWPLRPAPKTTATRLTGHHNRGQTQREVDWDVRSFFFRLLLLC